MSTKGSGPRKGHNAEKQRKNYDCIDWSKKPSAPRTEQPRSKSTGKLAPLKVSNAN